MENEATKKQVTTTVRRLVARELDMPESALNDATAWIQGTTPEDGGWLLAKIQEELGCELFDDYISVNDADRIATVGGLISYVLTRMEQVKR